MALHGGCAAVPLLSALLAPPRSVAGDVASRGDTVQEPPGTQGQQQEEEHQAGETAATAPSMAEDGDGHLRFGPYDLSGDLGLGIRLLDVSGNRAQFDEDLNLQGGLFLRGLTLEGTRVAPGSGPRSLTLRAFGIGTNDASAFAGTSFDGLDVAARYDRTRYSGTTSTDIHSL